MISGWMFHCCNSYLVRNIWQSLHQTALFVGLLLFPAFVDIAIRVSTWKRSMTHNQNLHKRWRHVRMQMYTHIYRYTNLWNLFYSICSEYEAHSERIKSHLPRLVWERDRDGASSGSPMLAQQLVGLVPPCWAGFPCTPASSIDQCHMTTTHSKLAASKPGSIQHDANEAWEDLVFLFQDFVLCSKSGGAGNAQMELPTSSLWSPTVAGNSPHHS